MSATEAVDNTSPPPNRLQLQGYNAIEFVVPGTRFFPGISCWTTASIEKRWPGFVPPRRCANSSLQQNLGGWTKNGFGRFEVAQVGFEKLGSDQREQPLFEPSIGKAEFNQQSLSVLEALDDWAEAAQNLSAAEIEKLYELRED